MPLQTGAATAVGKPFQGYPQVLHHPHACPDHSSPALCPFEVDVELPDQPWEGFWKLWMQRWINLPCGQCGASPMAGTELDDNISTLCYGLWLCWPT